MKLWRSVMSRISQKIYFNFNYKKPIIWRAEGQAANIASLRHIVGIVTTQGLTGHSVDVADDD